MSKSTSNVGGNSGFVGIRCTSSSQVSPDTYGTEKLGTPVINIDALRAIGRVVQGIKQRIAAGTGQGHATEGYTAGDGEGSTATRPNSGKDSNREDSEDR